MSDLKKPTKYDAWAYVLIGLIAIPLVAAVIGALVLPPPIAFKLVIRGLDENRPGWLVLGILVGAFWMLFLWGTVRRLRRARPSGGPSGPEGRHDGAPPSGDVGR